MNWRPPAAFFTAANGIVRWVLRSPLHRVLSGRLMVIAYEGARTGRPYAIPVAYYRWSPGEVWAFAARTGWASNFRSPRTVRLTLAGRAVAAEAELVEDRERVADLLRDLIRGSGPKVIQDPFLGLPKDREPTREETLAAADKARITRFRLSSAR
ncbi:hypothetical protein ABZ639_31625 [Saccharomonospora sp. NPDC006951]